MSNNVGQSKAINKEDKNLPKARSLSEEWSQLKNILSKIDTNAIHKEQSVFLCADSRTALSKIPENSISCIITSPPYGDLKNYGSENQIGYGQNWEKEYLPDLEEIFSKLYRVAKQGAAMWVVLDMIKEGGEMMPLPWEVITRSKNAGWTFQDLVIWDKGKSLPWSSQGKFRGVCEYILLLGKGKLAKFNLDAVRDSENLSSYWVKYPERYHPDGKAPSDLWHFPIPNQGSWSKKQSRHYCPFPIGLIARMIAISTDPNDVVLDPFAGTGSVCSVASYLERRGVGIEINDSFGKDFSEFGFVSITEQSQAELPNKNTANNSLREIIIKLRIQKYAKTLFSGLSRADQLNEKARNYIGSFFVKSYSLSHKRQKDKLDSGNLGQMCLQVLLKEGADKKLVDEAIAKRVNVAPLAIFGIKSTVETIPYEMWNSNEFTSSIKNKYWYLYKNGKFYCYDSKISRNKITEILLSSSGEFKKMPDIISIIKLTVESPIKV